MHDQAKMAKANSQTGSRACSDPPRRTWRMPDAPGQREHERREARGEHPFQACQSEGAPAKLFTEHHPDLAEGKKRERARKRESERRWLAPRAQQEPGCRMNVSLL